MRFVDMHLHSHCSDGADPPARVAGRAAAIGCAAMALTDHDTTAGVDEARAAAEAAGMGFLTGVEISARHADCGVHVLALGVRIDCPDLASALAGLREARESRGRQILVKLNAAGVALDPAPLEALGPRTTLGRMHIACALRDQGFVSHPQQAFDQFLNPGRPAWVAGAALDIEEAIARIHAASGLAFLAHPGLTRATRRIVGALFNKHPFDGIEAYHVSHGPARVREYLAFANSRGLLVTGGSDCHGNIKGAPEMGKVKTPHECYERIRDRLGT